MDKLYTTGEVSKLCGVSIRTVQYYDRNHIVKPSHISDAGHRLYRDEDIEKFKCVCFYKSLGFSLAEIKEMVDNQSMWMNISQMIARQEKKISEELLTLQTRKDHLSILHHEIAANERLTVKDIDALHTLIKRQNRHKKIDTMTYLLLICYLLIVFVGFIITTSMGGIYPIIMCLLTAFLLFCLIYYHASNNAYICPHCHQKFTLTFLRDMVTLNNGKQGKILKCPHCGIRTSMKETFRDD